MNSIKNQIEEKIQDLIKSVDDLDTMIWEANRDGNLNFSGDDELGEYVQEAKECLEKELCRINNLDDIEEYYLGAKDGQNPQSYYECYEDVARQDDFSPSAIESIFDFLGARIKYLEMYPENSDTSRNGLDWKQENAKWALFLRAKGDNKNEFEDRMNRPAWKCDMEEPTKQAQNMFNEWASA